MKKAGCTMILFGVESGSNRILKSINKKINLKTIKNTFSLCNKLKIPTSGYFIIGLPEDTQNSIIKTINFAIKLNPNFAVFSYPSPDFRTKLRQKMIEDNLLNQDKNIHFDRGGGNNSAIATKHLSSEQIEYFQKLAFKKFYFRWKYFQAHAWKFLTPDRISVIINEFLSMIKNYYLPQKYF
jgi:radical SAM superfamily enzyme YgiQ (UPF0313 family)